MGPVHVVNHHWQMNNQFVSSGPPDHANRARDKPWVNRKHARKAKISAGRVLPNEFSVSLHAPPKLVGLMPKDPWIFEMETGSSG